MKWKFLIFLFSFCWRTSIKESLSSVNLNKILSHCNAFNNVYRTHFPKILHPHHKLQSMSPSINQTLRGYSTTVVKSSRLLLLCIHICLINEHSLWMDGWIPTNLMNLSVCGGDAGMRWDARMIMRKFVSVWWLWPEGWVGVLCWFVGRMTSIPSSPCGSSLAAEIVQLLGLGVILATRRARISTVVLVGRHQRASSLLLLLLIAVCDALLLLMTTATTWTRWLEL